MASQVLGSKLSGNLSAPAPRNLRSPAPAVRAMRQLSVYADPSHTVYYRRRAAQPVVCGSSSGGKHKRGGGADRLRAPSARASVNAMVAEVEGLLGRMEEESLPQPPLALQELLRTASSASTSSTTSTISSSSSGYSSESSSSSDSEGEAPRRARARASTFATATGGMTAADFERQRQELLARVASGSLAGPGPATVAAAAATPASSNVVPRRGALGGYAVAVPPAAATRVEVCLGKACQKRGAGQVLAELQGAAAGTATEVVGCTKCMGKCKLAPNVRVTAPGGRSVLHSGVSPVGVRAVLPGGLEAQAGFFP